ncbi:glycosyltransferase family 2 protein [Candidatus Neomarinimicrobiota bacterium]
MTPKVSVIITTYNHEQYIAEALESVLNQTYQDFEIIIINDGSQDKTADIVQGYADRFPNKINFINNVVNERPKLASNKGLAAARGEFIAFNDGDDKWYPTKLEKQMQVFDQDREERLGVVYCFGEQIMEDSSRLRAPVVANTIRGKVFKPLFYGAFFLKIAMVVRRSVIEQVGNFDMRYPLSGDYHFMLRVAAAGYEFDLVPEFLVVHRIHPWNESRDQLESNRNNREMLLDIASQYAEKIKEYEIDVDYRMAMLDLDLAWHYFVSGNLRSVRQTLTPVLRHYPSLLLKSKRYTAYYLLSFFPVSWVKLLENIPFLAPIFRGK